jgi:hypothetical protein
MGLLYLCLHLFAEVRYTRTARKCDFRENGASKPYFTCGCQWRFTRIFYTSVKAVSTRVLVSGEFRESQHSKAILYLGAKRPFVRTFDVYYPIWMRI